MKAVIKTILQVGTAAAIKKYGTVAVKAAKKELAKRPELKKHFDDLVNPTSAGQKTIKPVANESRASRSSLRHGAAGGAAIGAAAGVGGTAAVMSGREKEATKEDLRANPEDYATYSSKTQSAKDFRTAYAAAKKKKAKTFTFEGREYTTK